MVVERRAARCRQEKKKEVEKVFLRKSLLDSGRVKKILPKFNLDEERVGRYSIYRR